MRVFRELPQVRCWPGREGRPARRAEETLVIRGPRRDVVDKLILVAVAIAFVDESVRKMLPGNPVAATAVKDALLFLAASICVFRSATFSQHAAYLLAWVLVTFASATYVYLGPYGTVTAFAASLRTYTLSPLLLVIGHYLAYNERTRRDVVRIMVIGCVAAMIVGLLQELGRGSLPGSLSTRIYKEGHSLAGGLYVESLFASPQIFAQVIVVFAAHVYLRIQCAERGRGNITPLLAFVGAALAILMSRIRTAAGAIVLVTGMTWLLFKRTRPVRPDLGSAAIGAAANLGLLLLLIWVFANVPTEQTPYGVAGLSRDVSFYQQALDPQEIARRIRYPAREVERLRHHNWAFGHGVGTGGPIRQFLRPRLQHKIAVDARDSGIFLLYHEMGLIGLLAFSVLYLGLLVKAGLGLIALPCPPRECIPAFAIAFVFTGWFLLKSHSCLANGFSHALWLGSLGLCLGLLERHKASLVAGRGAEAARRPAHTDGRVAWEVCSE